MHSHAYRVHKFLSRIEHRYSSITISYKTGFWPFSYRFTFDEILCFGRLLYVRTLRDAYYKERAFITVQSRTYLTGSGQTVGMCSVAVAFRWFILLRFFASCVACLALAHDYDNAIKARVFVRSRMGS